MDQDDDANPSPIAVADAAMPGDETPPPRQFAAPNRSDDRVLGGVCEVIGHQLGIDPLWVRLAFVTTALAGGVGLVVYLGLWLAMRAHGRPFAWVGHLVAGVTLIAIVPILIVNSGGNLVDGPVAIIALLSGLAFALWKPRGGSHAEVDRSATVPTRARPPVAGRPSTNERRPRSPLGQLVLAGATVVAAVGAMIDQGNGGRLHPEEWLGTAAAICGVGLVVGAFAGRARWLIVPAAGFAVVGFVSGQMARLDIPLSNLAGDRYLTISGLSSGTDHLIRRGFGAANVYIQDDVVGDHHVRAALFAGSININIPDDVRVEVNADVDHGSVSLDGVEQSGDDVRVGPSGGRVVVVDASIVFGDIHIWRYSNDPPVVEAAATANLGALTAVSDGVAVTSDGFIVLGSGEAVIDPNDNVTAGYAGPSDRSAGARIIATSFGEYTLLPRSLLLDPFGAVLDLQAIRNAQKAPAVMTPPIVPTLPTVPPAVTTSPSVLTTLAPPTTEANA
ncbi:MAG: PspC domain-containing protein [Acidimicrobiia bacterium]